MSELLSWKRVPDSRGLKLMKFKCNLTLIKSDVVFVLGTQTSFFFVVVVAGSEGAGRSISGGDR